MSEIVQIGIAAYLMIGCAHYIAHISSCQNCRGDLRSALAVAGRAIYGAFCWPLEVYADHFRARGDDDDPWRAPRW